MEHFFCSSIHENNRFDTKKKSLIARAVVKGKLVTFGWPVLFGKPLSSLRLSGGLWKMRVRVRLFVLPLALCVHQRPLRLLPSTLPRRLWHLMWNTALELVVFLNTYWQLRLFVRRTKYSPNKPLFLSFLKQRLFMFFVPRLAWLLTSVVVSAYGAKLVCQTSRPTYQDPLLTRIPSSLRNTT